MPYAAGLAPGGRGRPLGLPRLSRGTSAWCQQQPSYLCPRSRSTRLTEIERSVNLLLNVTPVNAAEAWADFERSDFGRPPRSGCGRWSSSRTSCAAISTTSRSRTSLILPCTASSGRRGRSHEWSLPWRIVTPLGSCTGHCSSTGGITAPLAGCGGSARGHPHPGSQYAHRHGRGVRRCRSGGVRPLPCRVSGFPGQLRSARRRLRADGVLRSVAHSRVRILQD